MADTLRLDAAAMLKARQFLAARADFLRAKRIADDAAKREADRRRGLAANALPALRASMAQSFARFDRALDALAAHHQQGGAR